MAQGRMTRAFAAVLVVAAAVYALALCWLFSRGLPITNSVVAIADAAIVLLAGALVVAVRPGSVGLVLVGITLNFLVIAVLSQQMDFKSARDAFSIIVFLGLGLYASNAASATRVFFVISAAVLGFGLFELIAPSLYANAFHVLQFYIMRGLVDPRVSDWFDGSLFVSSMRGGARNLLPMLGPHRVSSIFMEPVSMGNFGAIAVAWALSLDRRAWRIAIAAGIIGGCAIVMADARFAAIATALFVVVRVIPLSWSRYVLAPAPLLTVALLFWASATLPHVGDDLPSRLASSGAAIENLTTAQIFGLAPGGAATVDSGYAYVLSAFGLPLCVALWASFILLPAPSISAQRFKLLVGFYICALLCVSGSSLFALKTGALLWFMLGAMIATAPAYVVTRTRRSPALDPAYSERLA